MTPEGNAETLPLTELPRYLKQNVIVSPEARDKRRLDAALVTLLEDFFSIPRLEIDHDLTLTELKSLRAWRPDIVFSKLRSLLEKQSRRDIQSYCSSLDKQKRTAITKELHGGGIYHFRENLETDLYVGIHTAISANFKMLGVVYSNASIPKEQQDDAVQQLLRALRCIATQPLGILIALDGVFWDSKLFSVPRALQWVEGAPGHFEINLATLNHAVNIAKVDEIPLGCPAMRARDSTGLRAIDFVQGRCLEVAKRYFNDRIAF